MESVSLEQSATVDELLEACIQAFGSSSHFIQFHSFIHIQSTKVAQSLQIWNFSRSCFDVSSRNSPVL